MAFLKKRLEEITTNKLEITSMKEFIQGLCSCSSQDTKDRTSIFLNNWQNNSKLGNLTLAYLNGSWKPTQSNSKVLRKQRPWEEFLRLNFSLVGVSINDENESISLNFMELIQWKFWKDLYENFGNKTVSFIFEKCLIISEFEEDFFVVIGTNGCPLHQKVSKASSLLRRRYAPANNDELVSNNPYEIIRAKSNSVTNDTTRKRKLSIVDELDVEFQKKIKMTEDILEHQTSEAVSFASEEKHSSIGVIRWFIPQDKVLQDLIQERERAKKAAGGKSSVPMSNNRMSGMSDMNFVGIFHDTEFRKRICTNTSAIQKQSCEIKFPYKTVPSEWAGLKINIPEPSLQSKKSMIVTVFKISETFARSHGIRVKLKQRRRKRLHETSDKLPFCNLNAETNQLVKVDKTKVGEVDHSLGSEKPPSNSTKLSPSYQMDECIPSSSRKMPFDPLMILPTSVTLYNKSSWSRWPKNHVMLKACSAETISGVKLLHADIFENTDVGVRFDKSRLAYNLLANIPELSKVLENIITFHRRVRDVHKLVKSCLTFWLIKKQDKIAKKEGNKKERQEWRLANPKVSKLSRSNKSIEIIDLTTNSPSSSGSTPEFFVNNDGSVIFANPNRTLQESSILTSGNGQLNSSELKLRNQLNKKIRRSFAYSRLKEKVPHSCIMMTLKQIFHASNADNLLGSKKNCRGFFSFLRKSIILAGTKSSLQLGQLMASVDPMDCEWLRPISQDLRNIMFAKVILWLFNSYVLVILRLSFYITEVNDSRFHASFYLRESWKSVSENIKHRFTNAGNLQSLASGPCRKQEIKRSSEVVNAKIRFLPKKNHDLRPILSLKKDRLRTADFRAYKMLITYLVSDCSPHRIRDPNVIRSRWVKFLQDWNADGQPKLFFVRADIKDAYPSVNMQKLGDILVENANNVGCMTLKDFKVISGTRILFRNTLVSDKNREDWNASILIRPCIVQDTGRLGTKINPTEMASQIVSCFKDSVVRIGKQRYTFEYGLPQGWVLSEGLCNIYYGSMDLKYFSEFLNTKGEFFMTSVDDYFYVTPNARRAWRFWNRMQKGIPEYSCYSNSSKMLTNLHPRSDVIIPDQECEWIIFCGWKFCLSCGHIMRDFSSYEGQDIASTISFIPRNVINPESFLIGRMKVMLPARLQQFLFDPAINCSERIIMNVYEAGLIFAFRFYAICRVIYPNLNAIKEPCRTTYIINAIYVCASTLARTVRNISRHTHPAKPSPIMCKKGNNAMKFCPCVEFYSKVANSKNGTRSTSTNRLEKNNTTFVRDQLQESEMCFIVYHAFIQKLMKHSQVFKDEILPKLHKMKSYQKSIMGEERHNSLRRLLCTKMPIHFQKIKI